MDNRAGGVRDPGRVAGMAVTHETVAAPGVPGLELGRLLGRGATSEVWEGVREADGRRVAVKIAHGDRESVEGAVREAALAATVASAHVVSVEGCLALADGRVALVMPLVRGGDLARLVAARGFLTAGEVVTVLAPLAGALGRLHGAGVVHGDVSPGNVLLDLDGRPLLADLGLGRVIGEEPGPVWGTEGCVAPEVLLGDLPSPASDVYALGALGWLCLTGALPGPPGLRTELAQASRAGPQARALATVLTSAVAPHTDERPDADEFAWALFRAADPAPLHLVSGSDDTSAVTFRIRAAARPDPASRRRRRGRHVRAPAPGRRGRRAAGTGLAVLAVVTAVASGATGQWSVTSGPGGPAEVPGVARPPAARVGDRTVDSDARAARSAPEVAPARLLEALAEARAAAWRAADPALLAEAEAAGSPLRARDAAAITGLARAGLRYAGLGYVLDGVRAVSAGDERAVLRARVGTTGYEVAGAPDAAVRPPSAGEPVLVDLRWTDAGWRVTDIRPDG